jgi:hypothetical protein
MRVAASIALALAMAGCRGEKERRTFAFGSSRTAIESDSLMQAARPLAGCYLLDGDGIGPYRVQLYPWRTARAWVARPLVSDTLAKGDSTEWSWTPNGPDGFEIRVGGVGGETDFTVRRSDSSWSAVMAPAPASAAQTTGNTVRAERIECPTPPRAVVVRGGE